MAPYDVVTFGEALLRLTPPNFERIEQATSFAGSIGGAELNPAVGLARLGLRVTWISRLPSNPLGRLIANSAREHGVDVSHVVWSKTDRAGVYFLEEGAAPRPSSILYDRADSACARLQPEEVDWEAILAGARVFQVTGVTPALSEGCFQATVEAIETARAAGALVSFDPNFRSKLWSVEEAKRVYLALAPQLDILFCSHEGLRDFYDIAADDAISAAQQARERFGLQAVVMTTREARGVRDNTVGSIVVADKVYRDREREVEVVERLGAGDAYAAGLLFGLLTGDWDKAVAYGGAAGALKHSIPGDFPVLTEEEIRQEIEAPSIRISR
ncbi:MAG: carbohydrate kinase [Dehalococcoidia bacterium]|nr:carbohydrate kinase [Dehalococcoidia bacterium]